MNNRAVRRAIRCGAIWIFSACPLVSATAQTAGLAERPGILNGLTPARSGRIADPSLDSTGISIVPSDIDALKGPRESSVAGPAVAALAARPPGTIELEILDAEISTRFASLEGCRIDAARRKRVPLRDIEADRLTLRWTIAETGQAIAAKVVGTTAIDAEVLDCVKRKMTGWTFSRPSGGPLPIERAFRFRALSPARVRAPLPTSPNGR